MKAMDEDPYFYNIFDGTKNQMKMDSDNPSSDDSQDAFSEVKTMESIKQAEGENLLSYNNEQNQNIATGRITAPRDHLERGEAFQEKVQRFRTSKDSPNSDFLEDRPAESTANMLEHRNKYHVPIGLETRMMTGHDDIELVGTDSELEGIDDDSTNKQTGSGFLNPGQQTDNQEGKLRSIHEATDDSNVRCAKSTRPGKRKDPIWALFTKVEQSTTETSGFPVSRKIQNCNACGLPVSAKADRMKKHIVTGCFPKGNLPTHRVRKPSLEEHVKSVDLSNTSESTESGYQPVPEVTLVPIPRKQCKIGTFVAKTTTTKAQKVDLDMKAAKFWYSSNLAFSAANLRTWKEFCSALRPGYEPPNDNMLQGLLLDKVSEEVRAQMENDLKGQEGTLIQDGWSNIHNVPILSHSVICNVEDFLINSFECKGDKKTAAYCAAKVEETMLMLREQGFKVVSGSTDNCNTMAAMRRILQSKFSDMLLYCCTPHMLNKLCEEVSPKEVINKINEVSRFFRDHHTPAAMLNERKGLKPQLPATTRWICHLECVRIFLANRTKYIEIAQLPSTCPPKIIETVNSLDVFKGATDLFIRMEEISTELLKLQADDSNVADAVHCWLKLYKSRNLHQFKSTVLAKMNFAIEPFFFVAYMMHPRYQGELLSCSQFDEAMDLLLLKDPEFVTVAQAFLAKDVSFFPKSSLHCDVIKISHPANWWSTLKHRQNIPNALIDFLRPMYRCPSSTASIERVFSTYGFVQTEYRNRLTQDKVMKLSFCFRPLRKQEDTQNRKRKLLTTSESR